MTPSPHKGSCRINYVENVCTCGVTPSPPEARPLSQEQAEDLKTHAKSGWERAYQLEVELRELQEALKIIENGGDAWSRKVAGKALSASSEEPG